MTQTPFEKFIALVEVDQKINSLNSSLSSHQKKIDALRTELAVNKQVCEKARLKFEQTRKEVDDKELEMKVLDQQESEKKARLETVANHKEYQSIKVEIDQLKKEQHQLEEQLMSVWNQLENAKKELDTANTLSSQQEEKIREHILEIEKQMAQIQIQKDESLLERSQKEPAVPEEWMQKYALMRARVTDPVVPVINESCTACFYKVSAQDMQELKRRKLVQCKDCYRLLYLQEVQQTAQNQ